MELMRVYKRLYFAVCFSFLFLTTQFVQAACGDPATLLSSIQGSTSESPLVGQSHTVEAVVTGAFQDAGGLRGFFLQEEYFDQDSDDTSSEGVFVFHESTPVEVGQLVRFAAEVQERFGQTQLARVTDFDVCDTDMLQQVEAAVVKLPFDSGDALEAYEGMLVHIKGRHRIMVTDVYNLGRFGEFVVSAKERLMVPTQVANPGVDADEVQARNELNQLIIDDGNNRQNRDPIVYPGSGLSAHNTLRTGDRVKSITGVLAYSFGNYRVHPTEEVRFRHKNKRPESPADDDDADEKLIIATFNVENYFNGDGVGGGFPTSRGADSLSEFERQSMKLGRAIGELNAAIVGVAELENDGYGDNSAIMSLTTAVNAYSYREYRYIDPGLEALGDDAIAIGMLYQPELVTPVGAALTMAEPPFDSLSRQPLAQAFLIHETNTTIMVVMNHFKSKSCSRATGDDRDQGDGQSCYNATRVLSASQLVDWLHQMSEIPHKILLGDLNSYAKEDPVNVLLDSGYHNELDEDEYTFLFSGQVGSLDYALFSDSLKEMVDKTGVWHINADEPRVLDYNEEFKSDDQLIRLFNDDPFRSSDHDPVYLILELEEDDD